VTPVPGPVPTPAPAPAPGVSPNPPTPPAPIAPKSPTPVIPATPIEPFSLDSLSNTFISSSFDSSVGCVSFGSLISINETESVPVENLKIKDKVYGMIEYGVFSTFEVEKITHSIGETTYKIVFEESELICSESHCIYVENVNNFKKTYELTINDKLKLSDKIVSIKSIQILKPCPVVGIFLSNNGCYFANGVLSHSQDTLPNFIIKQIGNSGVSYKEKSFRSLAVKSTPSCVVEGSLISTPLGKLPVEQINIGDEVFGLNKDLNKTIYKVVQKFSNLSHIIYELVFDDSSLRCSSSHCVFSFTQYKYVNAWALTQGEYILFENGIKELQIINKLNDKIVYSLKFENSGNYFAEGVFGHSENFVPEDFKNNSLKNSVFETLADPSSKFNDYYAEGVL
jgi:hypothetical protein